jgi:hypothetical protein
VEDCKWMFSGCTSLTEKPEIPDTADNRKAFDGCIALETISFNDDER